MGSTLTYTNPTERVRVAVSSTLEEDFRSLANEIVGRTQINLRDGGHIVSGALEGSYVVTEKPVTYGVWFEMGTPLEYGSYLEHGTKPHMPPLDPIKRWVQNKLDVIAIGIDFKGGKAIPANRRVRRFKGADKEKQILKVARQIQMAIAAHGTKARYQMRTALESLGIQFEVIEYQYIINPAPFLTETFWTRVREKL